MKPKFIWEVGILREQESGGVPGATISDPTPTPTIAREPEPAPAPAAPAPAPVAEPAVEAPKTISLDTFQQRVGALTRQKQDLEAQLAAERAAKKAQGGEPTSAIPTTPLLPEEEVNRRAELLANARIFNDKANAVNSAGIAKHSGFVQAVGTLNNTFGPMSQDFIESVIEAGESPEGAADIFYALGSDLEKATRIMGLSTGARAVALAKFAGELAPKGKGRAPASASAPAAPAPSAAPAPISPVVGSGSARSTPDLSDPKLPMEEFARIRREQRAQKGRR